ncbi:MAG: ParM/StbA family protein [Symploca sp. SIO1C4]|uniref:ParM/StbA family protein n=1 Tax=Symploca sp. SIO1C4 TaxID=2607765 RepID=A0A6B3NAV3_9CYAN|nr:ParM/StbA family protein [Symploca sp. SIO1C4]
MHTLKLFLDSGNDSIKWLTVNEFNRLSEPAAIRSIRASITEGNAIVGRVSNQTPVLELNGKTYHYGTAAYDYAMVHHIAKGDKASEILPNCLACIKPPKSEFKIQLVTSHPDPDGYRERLTGELEGSHRFTRNKEKAIAHIKGADIQVEQEGIGSWYYAQSKGLIPETGLTIIIDIGGATVISLLVKADGTIIDYDRNANDKTGALGLAQLVAKDKRLTSKLQGRVEPGLILDGFADGSHYYGDQFEASWKDWLDDYRKPWYRNILETAAARYSSHFGRVRRILITGGSSLLVGDLGTTEGIAKFCPDGRFANVQGLAIKHAPSAKEAKAAS